MNIISCILIIRMERYINGNGVIRKFSNKINKCKNINKEKNEIKNEVLYTRPFIDKENVTNNNVKI